jgi:hypothetical protein
MPKVPSLQSACLAKAESDIRQLNLIIRFQIIRNDLKSNKQLIGRKLLLGNTLHNLGHFHLLPLLDLLLVGKEGEQDGDTVADHADVEIVFFFKVGNELGESNVTNIHIDAVPGCPVPFLALDDGLSFSWGGGLRQCHERDGKVHKSIFVGVKFQFLTGGSNDLVELKTDETGYEGSRCGNGRDDTVW